MSEKTVCITNPDISQSAIEAVTSRFKTIVNQNCTKEGLLEAVRGVHVILWVSKMRLDKDILDAAGPQLEVIASMSSGLDRIDMEEVKKRGIKVSRTPGAGNSGVANIAVLLALAASRRLHEGRRHIENNTWDRETQWILGHDIEGSTVGIVGLGGIGQAVVKKLKGFEVGRFLYSGPKEKEEGRKLEAEFVCLDELLEQSDFVIVTCPLTPETKEMFNEATFRKMKKTAVFVNVGRGGIVDQPALIKALKEGEIFAAGLDVMTPEPLPPDHELLKVPNCVLMPHLGSETVNTRKTMAEIAAKNVVEWLTNGRLLTPVN